MMKDKKNVAGDVTKEMNDLIKLETKQGMGEVLNSFLGTWGSVRCC